MNIVGTHRIKAVIKDPPTYYIFYDGIYGRSYCWFEDFPDGTRIMRTPDRCKCH